jgi:hypothetical protein
MLRVCAGVVWLEYQSNTPLALVQQARAAINLIFMA